MPEPIKCFWIEPAATSKRYLRRYVSFQQADRECVKSALGYHNAEAYIGRFPTLKSEPHPDNGQRYNLAPDIAEYENDPRWPQRCDCGYLFTPDDEWQVFTDEIYKDSDGKEYSLRKPVPGMMWDARWFSDVWKSQDGRSLCAITPDGWTWQIDGPANNCTLPDDRNHKCWCRHGEVPNITVDKTPNPGERTCNAGGGSIQTPNWHGFLRNGEFVL